MLPLKFANIEFACGEKHNGWYLDICIFVKFSEGEKILIRNRSVT